MKLLNEARKTLVALLTAVGVATTALSDGKFTGPEAVATAVAFLGALGVFGFANVPKDPQLTVAQVLNDTGE